MASEHDIKIAIDLIDNVSSDMKAMRANMEAQFTKVNDKARQAKGAFASLGQEIKGSFVNAVKSGILAYAGFEVVGKITGFMKDARKEYQEAERAQMKLRTALGFTSIALQEQADALGRKLVMDNDEITAVQAMLGNYVKNEAQIKKLTPAVLDLAAATGMDMTTAANMVARGIADDNGELGRFKIEIDGAKGSAERIDSVLRGINTQFSGQAVAVADSADGWDKFSVAVKEASEKLWGFFTTSKEELIASRRIQIAELEALQAKGKTISATAIADLKAWKAEVAAFESVNAPKKEFIGPIPQTKAQREEAKKISEEAMKDQQKYLDYVNGLSKQGADDAKARTEADAAERIRIQEEEIARYNKNLEDKNAFSIELDKRRSDYAKMVEADQARARAQSIDMAIQGLYLLAMKNKEFAGLYKAAAISQAIVDTYKGANTALAAFAAFPPAGFAMAAAITAGGLANVAMIAQQQFATGTGYAPGGMAMVGETGAEMVNLPRGSSVTNNMHTNSTSNSNVTVNVLGSNGRVVESLRASLRSGSGDSLVRDLKAALA
jgi:hypothetical protein